ncbi:hypothetical protein PMI02_01631 [Novosphingobium sp. AP12]|nr:hypothetical protein PMI02_01631 [Novosphingobium sp. AP12]
MLVKQLAKGGSMILTSDNVIPIHYHRATTNRRPQRRLGWILVMNGMLWVPILLVGSMFLK